MFRGFIEIPKVTIGVEEWTEKSIEEEEETKRPSGDDGQGESAEPATGGIDEKDSSADQQQIRRQPGYVCITPWRTRWHDTSSCQALLNATRILLRYVEMSASRRRLMQATGYDAHQDEGCPRALKSSTTFRKCLRCGTHERTA